MNGKGGGDNVLPHKLQRLPRNGVSSMTLRQFIKDNRAEIDNAIARVLGEKQPYYKNDDERRLWILNDEGLYNWARREGVKI